MRALLPLKVTSASIPRAPTANEASLAAKLPELANRAIRIRRIVSSSTHATEASPNSTAVSRSTPLTKLASTDVTSSTSPTAAHCDWNSARRVAGIEAIEHRQRVADPAALDRVDGREDAEQQAERSEAGCAQRSQGDERQHQAGAGDDALRHHRGDRPAAHRQ